MFKSLLALLALTTTISAHTAAWAPGMYCRGGNSTTSDDQNTNLAVNPLYNMTKENWWFQHHRGCDAAPPKAGEFLEIPANGEFTVELAHNRAFTTLSYDGKFTTGWPDGKDHPEDWNGYNTDGTPAVCLKEDGALHTYNESSAGGTAFAISYQSELKDVTMENLVVFTALYHTPWKRLATYKVPDLQACPEGGCTCAWLWIPNGCGEANMYMQGFKCNITSASPTAKPLAPAKVPTYCADDPSKCVKGAKQMLAWHQLTGNNIETEQWTTPNYNQKCGWAEGAQTDIFDDASAPTSSSSVLVSSTSSAFSYASSSTGVVSGMSSAALSYTSVAPVSVSSKPLSYSTKESMVAPSSSVTAKDVQTPSSVENCASASVITVTAPAVTVTVTKYHSRRPSARAAV